MTVSRGRCVIQMLRCNKILEWNRASSCGVSPPQQYLYATVVYEGCYYYEDMENLMTVEVQVKCSRFPSFRYAQSIQCRTCLHWQQLPKNWLSLRQHWCSSDLLVQIVPILIGADAHETQGLHKHPVSLLHLTKPTWLVLLSSRPLHLSYS